MRISDWSSDVCSSDLCARRTNNQPAAAIQFLLRIGNGLLNSRIFQRFTRCIAHVLQKLRDRIKLVQHLACGLTALDDGSQNLQRSDRAKIGSASCRERGCKNVKIRGVAVALKK